MYGILLMLQDLQRVVGSQSAMGSLTTGFRLRAIGCGLPASGYRLPAMGCGLSVGFRLWTIAVELPFFIVRYLSGEIEFRDHRQWAFSILLICD